MSYLLEVCVDSVESAMAAEAGGADRIELCSNLIIGGTTPGYELYKSVREQVSIPVHVLIRPRFGDFLYSTYEKDIMRREIQAFSQMGADAVVIGMLKADGRLDVKGMEYILQEKSDTVKITLHRAFDMCANPQEAVKEASMLGIDTILTSGQRNTCMEGAEHIKEYMDAYGHSGMHFMAGGGIRGPEQVKQLMQLGISQFHMSGKQAVESQMIYRNEQVSMGLPMASEYVGWVTDAQLISEVRQVLG